MTPTSPTHHTRAAFVALLATLAIAALSMAGTAAATTPCGKQVLADWFDNGRIDRLYKPHCYEDAIDAIPADLRDYADAEEVISRALQGALRGELVEGGRDPSPDGNPRAPGSPVNPDEPGTGGSEATPEVDTSAPSSLPIPLLVLGGMSLALLAAGGLGYVSRRRNAAGPDEPDDDDAPF